MKHYFLRSIILPLSLITPTAFAQNDEATPQELLLQAREELNAVFPQNEPNQASSSDDLSTMVDIADALSSLIAKILESEDAETVDSHSFMENVLELGNHLESYFSPLPNISLFSLSPIDQISETIFLLEELTYALLPLVDALTGETINIFMICEHWEYFGVYLDPEQQVSSMDADYSSDSTDTDTQVTSYASPINWITNSDDASASNNTALNLLMEELDTYGGMSSHFGSLSS